MIIRPATPDEASLISELSMRSKAYWGYTHDFMRACEDELSHSEHNIQDPNRHYAVAEHGEKPAGFYTLEDIYKPTIHLLALFIEPEAMGQGIGRLLFDDAYAKAKKLGARIIEVQSDPYAETFYQKMGAVTVDKLESGSIKDRFLPLMQVKIR